MPGGHVDVFIAGGGALGLTYARLLHDSGLPLSILVVEAGAQLSSRPGEHQKNSYYYQKDMDAFTHVITGQLQPISVPIDESFINVISPSSFNPVSPFRKNGQNRNQNKIDNLPAAASTYAVGGMITHWTCSIPRLEPTLEGTIDGEQYIPTTEEGLDDFYGTVENIYVKNTNLYDQSARHKVVLQTLKDHFGDRLPEDRGIQPLPMAGRFTEGKLPVEPHPSKWRRITWTGGDTILGPLATGSHRFQILQEHVVKRLHIGPSEASPKSDDRPHKITKATVRNLNTGEDLEFTATYFVVACNPILTAQLLWASGIGSNIQNIQEEQTSKITLYQNLPVGRYLTEHPMTFCQIILHQDLINQIKQVVIDRGDDTSNYDETGMPFHEPPPNVWIPCSPGRPWHCQVHRDAFSYGAVPPNVDERAVVDLRWWGSVPPRYDNWVQFGGKCTIPSKEVADTDRLGMPQPTFHFRIRDPDNARDLARMQAEMSEVAAVLGGYFPGTEPKWMAPGLTMHFMGTYRMGKTNNGKSVADENSRVWLFTNLYVAGSGLLPTQLAANPTITAAAFAKKAVDFIVANHQH